MTTGAAAPLQRDDGGLLSRDSQLLFLTSFTGRHRASADVRAFSLRVARLQQKCAQRARAGAFDTSFSLIFKGGPFQVYVM